ncbi:MAG: GxxExxY protein [Cyclobacteriaceae bacterium]
MTENELAKIAVDIAYKLHTTLGPGLLESVYEEAFSCELNNRGVQFSRQQGIDVFYMGHKLGIGFRADLILENKLIIELKSVERVEKVHHKTILTYMKLTEIKLGLLINFNVNLIKEGIHRKIQGQLF